MHRKTWSSGQTSESVRPPRPSVPHYTAREANLSKWVRLQSIIGRSYPRESENTLAKVGAVTSGGSNHMKTLSTLSTTSHLRWAACVRGRVNLWGRSSSVFSCTPRRLNYSNPGCGKNKISQERTNRPQVGVSQRPQGYQFCHQCKKRTKKTTRTHDLRLAGEYRRPPLDCDKWPVPTVRL